MRFSNPRSKGGSRSKKRPLMTSAIQSQLKNGSRNFVKELDPIIGENLNQCEKIRLSTRIFGGGKVVVGVQNGWLVFFSVAVFKGQVSRAF